MTGATCSNLQIIRKADHLQFILPNGQFVRVNSEQWQAVVITFADALKSFYAVSAAKTPSDDFEAQGFKAMLAEWDRRRSGGESDLARRAGIVASGLVLRSFF